MTMRWVHPDQCVAELYAELAQRDQRERELVEALDSIAANGCVDNGEEAALVAKSALAAYERAKEKL